MGRIYTPIEKSPTNVLSVARMTQSTAILPLGLMDFAGRWALQRKIDDARGPDAVFEGTATLTAQNAGLLYFETGHLRLGDHAFVAERRYSWSSPAPGRIEVRFDDGRAFHAISLTQRPVARHDCDPDTYLVQYDFGSWPDWRCSWHVTGPRKDYRMVTDYKRHVAS